MTSVSLLTTLIQVEVGDLRESHLLEQTGAHCVRNDGSHGLWSISSERMAMASYQWPVSAR